MSPDWCFAAPEAFAGCVSSCRHAAAVLGGTWTVIPASGQMPPAVLTAKLLVVSTWDPQYGPLLAVRSGAIVPRWHSTIQQTEISRESSRLMRMIELLDQDQIPAIAVVDPALRDVLARDRVVHLPDVFADSAVVPASRSPSDTVNVSLFGAAHWRKNLLVQSAAFEMARRRVGSGSWTLHLTGQTHRDHVFGDWLRAGGVPFIDHGYLEHGRHLALIGAMDVGLCATLSESYGYVAAEHLAHGVPIVASAGVACLGDAVTGVRPDSVDAIAEALIGVLADRAGILADQRAAFDERASHNARIARAAIADLAMRVADWRAPTHAHSRVRFRELTLDRRRP